MLAKLHSVTLEGIEGVIYEVEVDVARGGSVESHLRFGKKIYSPIISRDHADYLVCFHEAEHRKLKVFLRPDGTDLA
jgi:indolepyruvate ferredoxin oxidoreductase beta subunit